MKEKIVDSLQYFFDVVGKQDTYRKISPDDFIIIGGASLVLQDRIDSTLDIDMISLGNYPFIVSPALRNAGYYPNYRTSERQEIGWVEVIVDGMSYDIFGETGMGNLISKPVKKKKVIKAGNMKLYVRPYKNLKKDALKVISDKRVHDLHKMKYKFRLKELQRF